MRLYDGPRQIVAALLASGVFLTLFFGLTLVWWAALGLGAACYGAALLVIERRRPLEEIQVSARVSAADIAAAAAALEDAGHRLEKSAAAAPKSDQPALTEMADDIMSIRQSILNDPEDYRAARSFINVYLPTVIQTVETYVKVAGNASGSAAARVQALGTQIQSFAPAIHRIRAACIENDLAALEVEVAVLSKTFDKP